MVAIKFTRASTLDNKNLQHIKYNIEKGLKQYSGLSGSCPKCICFATAIEVILNEVSKGKGHGNRFGVGYIMYVLCSLFPGDFLGLQASVQKSSCIPFSLDNKVW